MFQLSRLRAALTNERGSIGEAIGGAMISFIVIGVIATTAVNAMTALTQFTSDSERMQTLAALTGNPSAARADFPDWTTNPAPVTKTIELTSGGMAPVTVWSTTVAGEGGTTYYAAIPHSGRNVNCGPTSGRACLYESHFIPTDRRGFVPPSVITTKANFAAVIPLRTVIATATAPATTNETWRFFIEARAEGGAPGTIVIMQGADKLTTVPIKTTDSSYFGTIDVEPGSAIKVLSPDRDMTVTSFVMYDAQ